jgi:hypothetical protein
MLWGLVACETASSGPEDSDCASYAAGDFVEEMAEAICDHIDECPHDASELGYVDLTSVECDVAVRHDYEALTAPIGKSAF